MTPGVNEFFDINKLPKGFGILVFPISIARADNRTGQGPEQCMEYVRHFSPSKIAETKVGLNMIYGDFLYLHSKEEAGTLKQKFMNIVLNHKNAFQKILKKAWNDLQIQHAFSYEVWNQLYLSYDGDFDADFRKFKKQYLEDKIFQKYVQEDADHFNRELTEEQLNFFLEEHFMFYLLSKKCVQLPNEYVLGREEWVLWCYPGVPLKGQIYVYQTNPLSLEAPGNTYQNSFYDLESKKLVDYLRIDLETYDYKYNN